MQKQGTVFDLEEAELCYAPQFGAAKDALNCAGFMAANNFRGDLPLSNWNALPDDAFLLDVRDISGGWTTAEMVGTMNGWSARSTQLAVPQRF